MKALKNYFVITLIALISFSCQQENDVKPELTFEEKFEIFSEAIFEMKTEERKSSFYTKGSEVFNSFKSYDGDIYEYGPRTEGDANYVVEIDGSVYIVTITENCMYYAHLDCFFSSVCSGTGSWCEN